MITTEKLVVLFLHFDGQTDNRATIFNAATEGYLGELYFDWYCNDIGILDFLKSFGKCDVYVLVSEFCRNEAGAYWGDIMQWSETKEGLFC